MENFVAVVVVAEFETFFSEVYRVPKKKLFFEEASEPILVVA